MNYTGMCNCAGERKAFMDISSTLVEGLQYSINPLHGDTISNVQWHLIGDERTHIFASSIPTVLGELSDGWPVHFPVCPTSGS